MKRALVISVITLVAVIMGMSAVAPIMAHNVSERNGLPGNGACPDGFSGNRIGIGVHPDHNRNEVVCTDGLIVIDDLPCRAFNGSCPPAEPP